jgi:hypothetical protein
MSVDCTAIGKRFKGVRFSGVHKLLAAGSEFAGCSLDAETVAEEMGTEGKKRETRFSAVAVV